MAHWRYYGDNTGALVDMAYAKHAAHLLHSVTHNHQPEVREAAAIRIKEAQMARNTCPRWILAQHGVSTPVGTGIWAQLQLLLPHHTHAMLTNHHCDQQGPLVATHTDIHRRPAGKVDTLRLVGATITIVYITPTQMKIMAQCDAQHAPFLSDPQWPARHVFQAYLRACATKAGRDMPAPKDIDTAYTAFQRQHPRPRPSEHETPNDGSTTQGEPTPSAEGWTPPTILLLAPNIHKHATRTVQRHHAPWSIPKHNAPETDVPPVRHSDQGIPRTCWHCGSAALDTPCPLLHLISTHYRTPTAAATADQQAWLSPWFHTVPPDHPVHVAWTRTPTATWTFTNERADPDSVAMKYDRCDPQRAGPQEAPMRPLQHKCPTLRGDKDDKERRQTITCQKFHPNTGYLFHLMYAYITQGRPDRGLLRLTPRAQAIITQGIGVYAAPLLQPTQITARTTQGNPIYVYHPTAIARLPIPSDTDIIYFTDASSTKQRTPTVRCASVRITRHADGLHVEHHTGTTIFGASSHGELRTMGDAVTATPPPTTVRPRNIWVVVDATVDIHPTRRLADLPLHKALESGLTTQALGLWMAFKGMHPQDALHIVKQESHRYAYGNGRADTQAKHQNTNHIPGLERVRLDTPHHSHPQHLPLIPLATQPPQWMPEDTPYTDRDKQYHYPTPIQQLATTLGHPANTELLRRLEDSVHTPLYYSALRPDSLPAHLQKPRLQLALEQLPLLSRYHRWYTRRSIQSPQDTPNAYAATRRKKHGTTSRRAPCTEDWTPSQTGTQPTPSHSTPDGWRSPRRPSNSPPSSSRRRCSRQSAGDSSPLPSTPCYAPTRRTPRPRRRTCSGRPLPRRRSSSHTAPTNFCSMRQPCPQQTKPTSSNSCSTNHENLPRDIPTRNPHHVYTPSTEHSTGTAHTGATGTAHAPTSMRAPPAPIPPRRRPSTGTSNHQPPHVPSAFASGYHRQPCPATQTTGSPWEPRTASPTAPTAGTSTPATANGPRPQPHPPLPATQASLGSSPTPCGTNWEGTTWRTRRTTHGPQPWPRATHPCSPTAHPYGTAEAA